MGKTNMSSVKKKRRISDNMYITGRNKIFIYYQAVNSCLNVKIFEFQIKIPSLKMKGLHHGHQRCGTASCPHVVQAPTVISMVGLPARGKTYMSKKLSRYLNWIGVRTRAFNVGEYRRAATNQYRNHDFFRKDNVEAQEIRNKCALMAVEDACNFLKNGGEVAVLDATNTTRERRKLLVEIIHKKNNFRLFFEVKVCSPDYTGMDKNEAVKDFLQRVDHYKDGYEELNHNHDKDLSFIQIFNQGERFLVHKLAGHLQSRVVYYLMNIHVLPRTIYLTRHGESEMNLQGRIGGDSELSNRGREISNLKVWTSELKRTKQTSVHIDAPIEHWKALNEIDAGICEEMTYEEIQEKYPQEFALRDQDKFHYRYPSGESYQDLVARLEPVIMELERQENVMVICHQAVLRCLLAYFQDKSSDEIPWVPVPWETVVKMTISGHGVDCEHFHLLSRPSISQGSTSHCHQADASSNVTTQRSVEDALETVPPHW
ncbi:hypothetical protein KUTeg_021339 [Tegillarca granosa]|uniref:6-phosphofructo-2-kinase domain-containing protein n=1 Tax=Tegillarca granosa TaxID=220873 RepID=A0ABQ9EFK5_TEGGR|nr:hypothetical protein KUTeg_021339 [Tegillarca granosa]